MVDKCHNALSIAEYADALSSLLPIIQTIGMYVPVVILEMIGVSKYPRVLGEIYLVLALRSGPCKG